MMDWRPICFAALTICHYAQVATSSFVPSRPPCRVVSFLTRIHSHPTNGINDIDISIDTDNDSPTRIQQLQTAYDSCESDGVREWALLQLQTASLPPAPVLWEDIRHASQGQTGVAASMLHACLASFVATGDDDNDNSNQDATAALDLFQYWIDERGDEVQPSVLTFALTFASVSDDAVLDLARRWSKKKAGSKRRKALAAARRHTVDTATNRLQQLRALLGNEELDVLQETDDFVVVTKPASTSGQHRLLTTAGKSKKKKQQKNQRDDNNENDDSTKSKKKKRVSSDMSLVDALLQCNVPLSTLNPECQGLVHRLDRGTSGCLLLAKTDAFHALAVAEFYCRNVSKRYLTLVSPAPVHNQGDIDFRVDQRPARSSYQVLERLANDQAALVEFVTYTGRKHQVRVHCAQALHTPVLCDQLYGDATAYSPQLMQLLSEVDKMDDDNNKKERFFLHAQSLSIPNLGIDVQAPIPQWWQPTLQALKSLSQ